MPQDKRRSSISYRSFVTCDDPKGVECGVIRKSKINNNSQKKEQDCSNKVEADRKQRNQNTSLVVASVIKEERDKKEMGVRGITRAELENPVSFQLLEVSKETEKLNHVINSWSSSSGSSYDKLLRKKQNDSVAKDLLRGALDLQESLVMLGKLQEASSYMLGLSRKQKQKLDEGAFDVMVSGVRGNSRPAMHHVDGYPRKSVDEMRNVVRDSLLRQNMISNPIFEEHYDHRKMSMASPDMLPSTSSSTQSSMIYSSNFVPSDSSVSSSTASRRKNGKDSNLIVRLMGLESFPSSPRKHTEREKLLNLAKPTYEIDSPRAKRPQFGAQEVGLKQRSVEEILERLKFKGLLKNNSVDGLTIHSSESENYSSNNSWVDERPPIVVMKPMRYPCLDLDEPYKTKFWGERDVKPRCSRGSAQEIVRNEAVNYSEKNEVARVDCEEKAKSVKKVASAKLKGSVNVKPKAQKKQTEVKKATEVEKVTPTRRKVEEKKDARSSDQLNSRDQERFSTAKITRQKDGKSISKNQSSNQQNTTSTSMLDQRKRRTSERKKNRQPALEEEKRICKGEKKRSTVFYKEDIDSAGDRTSVFPAVNSFTGNNNDNERCQSQIRDYDFDSQIKLLDTPDRYSCLPNDKNISHYDDNQSSYSEITSVSTSEYCNVDQLSEAQSTLHEVTLITTHENGIAVHHETNQEGTKSLKNSVESTDNKALRPCLTPRMKLKALLLNNSSFVSHIEELFNIQVNPESVPCMIDDNDQDSESSQILVDCANELLELKSSQFLQTCLPLPRIYTTKLQSYFSLDWLLEEVCNGIESLRFYSRPVNDEFPFDDLYVILDRDLEFKSITWEVGWKSMFTLNEVEQVIGEVDKFILGNLIQEVVSDFML
ncbi:uncharacterized protein LOC110691010 isoform X2 [Chenopodium quinoa]|uniref:uncharacterized protein LOC110691010 isoform X2 n=1 Tax=Chenopodium quinoa TaxID=63459 RepID=UPI000B784262|nr:uncharacterized protein LOC110691010 isoform X2 [Chenopodium quinoa]